MSEEKNRPHLHQRCHIEGKGFGTITRLMFDPVRQKQIAYVALDAGIIRRYTVDQLELLPANPTS
jgi:hypothetical protein